MTWMKRVSARNVSFYSTLGEVKKISILWCLNTKHNLLKRSDFKEWIFNRSLVRALCFKLIFIGFHYFFLSYRLSVIYRSFISRQMKSKEILKIFYFGVLIFSDKVQVFRGIANGKVVSSVQKRRWTSCWITLFLHQGAVTLVLWYGGKLVHEKHLGVGILICE